MFRRKAEKLSQSVRVVQCNEMRKMSSKQIIHLEQQLLLNRRKASKGGLERNFDPGQAEEGTTRENQDLRISVCVYVNPFTLNLFVRIGRREILTDGRNLVVEYFFFFSSLCCKLSAGKDTLWRSWLTSSFPSMTSFVRIIASRKGSIVLSWTKRRANSQFQSGIFTTLKAGK